MLITLVDIISFFDREDISDVMETLNRIGVNKKAAMVWFKLNEGTEIAVKTATGVSETAVVGDKWAGDSRSSLSLPSKS